MPRFARMDAPGAVVHVISRFVNRSFRLATATDRALVLDRMPRALGRSDWRLLGYALMSSHIHLVMHAGQEPPWRFLKPFQTAVARRLNRCQRAFGPVFAERATTIVVPPERTGELLAYVHNNPVRAQVVVDAGSSTWTSHRAYLAIEEEPPWLDVSTGLLRAGYDLTPAGRSGFADFVRQRANQPRDGGLSGATLASTRARVRSRLAMPIELSSSVLDVAVDAARCDVLSTITAALPRWTGDLLSAVDAVCDQQQVAREEVCSGVRSRRVTEARRLIVIVGHLHLRRPLVEVASAIGIPNSTASQMLGHAPRLRPIAAALANRLGHR